jgi:hypothetical protein
VLVWERGGARRPAAERWWRHETGETVAVCEGVVWALRFAVGTDAAERCASWRRHAISGTDSSRTGSRRNIGVQDQAPPLAWIVGESEQHIRRGGMG